MAIIIEMPKLSDTMTEGKILSWLKSEGDELEPGEILAEVESDKANMELEVYDAGFLRKLLVAPGEACPVGAAIAVVTEEADEDIEAALAGLKSPSSTNGTKEESAPRAEEPRAPAPAAPSQTQEPAPAPAPPAAPGPPPPPAGGRVLASPLALRMMAEYGLGPAEVPGTGPEGRIVKRDVEQALARRRADAVAASNAFASTAPPPFQPVGLDAVPEQSFESVPVTSMRKVIAERLTHSMQVAPHFYLTMQIDMRNAIRAREHVNGMEGVKVSFNDFVVKATALALTRHPTLNSSWAGDKIHYYKSIDIGIAVALPEGLLTPVVRGCHLKGLARLSQEIRELAQRAKERKLKPEEYQGGSFTISNLGMFGVKHFTAIVNPPQTCILAVSAIRDVPVVDDGKVVPGSVMECTVSCDHRVVDGAQAAHFMRDLKSILENPVSLAL